MTFSKRSEVDDGSLSDLVDMLKIAADEKDVTQKRIDTASGKITDLSDFF